MSEKYALISVSNKEGLVPLVSCLLEKNYRILSTGGTYNMIKANFADIDDSLIKVSDFTGYPEILGGRVKTLHPKIYGGLLWDDKFDVSNIQKIDLVVVNLYPFEKVTSNNECNLETAIENIDIGGVSLIRAAAKNFKNVRLLVDPNDYEEFIGNWDSTNSPEHRRQLAVKGFDHVTKYDANITHYLNRDICYRRFETTRTLKYGCNPYQNNATISKLNNRNIPFKVLNGNPGYINLLDAVNSWLLVIEVEKSIHKVAASSFKHTAPAGVAYANGIITTTEKTIYNLEKYDLTNSPSGEAFIKARNADPLSSFGDFVSISGVVDKVCAQLISREVSDGIIARGYTDEALAILKSKKKGNYIILEGDFDYTYDSIEYREIAGFALSQRPNNETLSQSDLTNVVTSNNNLDESAKLDMILATITLKYTPSNSITFAKNGVVIGVGAGQQNRVDCIKLAGEKSLVWRLRRHPKVVDLFNYFNDDVKRQDKTNAITKYINGDFSESELQNWRLLFKNGDDIQILTKDDKNLFLIDRKIGNDDGNVCLSSDAFMPFRDNIDTATKYSVSSIIQPGGSLNDSSVIEACNEYNIAMVFSGKRFFLH
jgi:phosphoribosylaminoimidazolecarboxamide formyltransferase/IMP cyclohydrolase